MPKVTLIQEFNLPEENEEYYSTFHAKKYELIVHDFKQWLRNQLKYPSEDVSDEAMKILEMVREELYELEEEYLSVDR